jgi:transposase-like protein
MPRMYSVTVRRQIVSRLRSGEAVAAVAAETGIAEATLFRWKRMAANAASLPATTGTRGWKVSGVEKASETRESMRSSTFGK